MTAVSSAQKVSSSGDGGMNSTRDGVCRAMPLMVSSVGMMMLDWKVSKSSGPVSPAHWSPKASSRRFGHSGSPTTFSRYSWAGTNRFSSSHLTTSSSTCDDSTGSLSIVGSLTPIRVLPRRTSP